jgi:hypothetical protein
MPQGVSSQPVSQINALLFFEKKNASWIFRRLRSTRQSLTAGSAYPGGCCDLESQKQPDRSTCES